MPDVLGSLRLSMGHFIGLRAGTDQDTVSGGGRGWRTRSSMQRGLWLSKDADIDQMERREVPSEAKLRGMHFQEC